MATEVGQAYVTLIPSARGFAQKMQAELSGQVGKAGRTSGDQYGEQFSRSAASKVSGRGKAIFGALGKAAFAGVAATAGVATILKGSIEAASDLGETLSKSSQIFGKEALPALEQFADTAATGLGQSKQQALDAAATFAIFGKSAGLSGKKLVGFSTDFTSLASDMASFHNSTPQEAIDAIGAALRGEAEPMRRFGVLLDDASMRAEAMRLGLTKTTKEALTPQQKVLAAQALIYKQTGDAQGDFAKTSGGMANQQRIAAAQFANAKTELGKGLLPVITDLFKLVNKVLPDITEFASMVGDKLGPAFSTAFGPETGGRIKGVLDKLSGFADAIGLTGEGLSGWIDLFKQTWDTIVSVFDSALDILRSIWSTFGADIIKYVANSLTNFRQIFGGILDIIKGVFELVAALIHGDWPRVWEALKTILSGAWQAITGILKQALNVFGLVFKVGWTLLVGILKRVWELIKLAVVAGINAQLALLRGLAGKAVSALGALGSALSGAFRTAWNAAKAAVVIGVTAVVNYVKGLPGKLRGLASSFASAGAAIIGAFVNGLKSAAGVVGGIAGNVWDAVRGLINSAIDQINAALSFTISLPGPDISVNPPDIPHLASGARVSRGTLAVIGEGREAETVLPDSMLRGLLERTRDRSGVAELVITNWAEGTGYFRLLAGGEVAEDAKYRRAIGAMHA